MRKEKTAQGDRQKKSVQHDYFKLSTEYQGEGLAAKVLASSLETYLNMGVAEIKTEANIDMGGYVWQGYGFGWDMEKANMGLDVHENPQLAERNLEIYVKRKIRNAKENATQRLKLMGLMDEQGKAATPEIQSLLDEYDTLAERGLGATPQDLARIGKDAEQVRFYRQVSGSSFMQEETWMTAEEFKRRRSSGELSKEVAKAIEKNAFHMGKLGMAHGDFVWDGKIDLHPGSPSRTILEDKLHRSTKD